MTRILVQRGSGSSSGQNRSSGPGSGSLSASTQPQSQSQSVPPQVNPEENKEPAIVNELPEYRVVDSSSGNKTLKSEDLSCESPEQTQTQNVDKDTPDAVKMEEYEGQVDLVTGLGELTITEHNPNYGSDGCSSDNNKQSGSSVTAGSSHSQPPPPPVPPPKPSSGSSSNLRRIVSGTSGSPRIGPSRRPTGWPAPARTSPTESRPSSPRSHGESEGYNSADEQNPCFGSSIYDLERERQFEIDIRRAKGLEVKRMLADGNCLFRAVADQVYGDSEAYDLVRQMCIDYMERERDHFSQFITEGFTSYCKRKRRDKVYGNNVEIQALSEMYNRPIHIYSYSTEPINIFHGNYDTDTPPIRLSYHHGNHYNSLVDPRRLNVGAGLGFSSLRGRNVDKDQVKAAIKAQQDQQLDNALLAEGQFYSDLELTEKEIECMVMEASRAEYLSGNKSHQYINPRESSTSGAEPSSSGSIAGASGSENDKESETIVSSSSMQLMLSMGFSYMQVIEAYSIFGDDVDSMVCFLLETASSSRRSKGKATE